MHDGARVKSFICCLVTRESCEKPGLTNYSGLEFQKIHLANRTVFFRFSIISEEERKPRGVDPNS